MFFFGKCYVNSAIQTLHFVSISAHYPYQLMEESLKNNSKFKKGNNLVRHVMKLFNLNL